MDNSKEDIDREKRVKEDRRVIFVLSFCSVLMIIIPVCFFVLGK